MSGWLPVIAVGLSLAGCAGPQLSRAERREKLNEFFRPLMGQPEQAVMDAVNAIGDECRHSRGNKRRAADPNLECKYHYSQDGHGRNDTVLVWFNDHGMNSWEFK